ncbi:MAG: hypothetical protein K2N87_03275 [Eubacterium sp.]|nr:hypothetical protein [Eubacterium sp.]
MSEIGVNINTTAATYATAYNSTTKADSKTETTKDTDKNSTTGAVYEKDSDKKDKATYSVNKMSAEKRAELVKQMKQDAVNRQNQLVDIVNKSLFGQAKKFSEANDDFWSTMAKGGFSVDAAAKQKAQELISEDGYYGVKQTSQRIFDFASALAGDDVEKMKEMQAAFEKGYKLATKSWGKELPDISKQTHKAVTDLFEDYYDSKKVISTEA